MKRWEEKGISFEMQSGPKIKKISHLLSNNCFLNDALGVGYVAVSSAKTAAKATCTVTPQAGRKVM